MARYSRQIIVPSIGVRGQLAIQNASVLVCGVGGLGCAVALYLAGAGIGRLGLCDGDTVELNNLHRQLLHTERSVGEPKALSGKRALDARNADVRIVAHNELLTGANAMRLLRAYDIIVDASDNAPTRYLLSDACVLLGRPLVSGSAIRLEGQLTVYNADGGPCYRCVYPVPTPARFVGNCGDEGVVGAVVGVIGTLQAMEVLKLAAGFGETLSGVMLIYEADRAAFRRFNLRKRNAACAFCGDAPTVTALLADYEAFCGARACDKVLDVRLLDDAQRLGVEVFGRQLSRCRERGEAAVDVVLDVRSPVEFEIGSLPGAVNVPWTDIEEERVGEEMLGRLLDGAGALVVVCRRGNDSQRAVLKLGALSAVRQRASGVPARQIRDLAGGLRAWSRLVDKTFPIY